MGVLLELFLTFGKIGAFTFGGGYAMLALLDHECVEKKKWISPEELADITAVAESTPGPIALNCATYTGYVKGGFPGAVSATLGMVLPSFIVLLIISKFFEDLLSYQVIANAFRGIRAAVAILIIQAGLKMVKKMRVKSAGKKFPTAMVVVFFTVLFVSNILGFKLSTIYLMIVAGAAGWLFYSRQGKENGI